MYYLLVIVHTIPMCNIYVQIVIVIIRNIKNNTNKFKYLNVNL
jgi:hypothetical protein